MPVPHPLPIALTYEDYLGFPDDGNRHEILEGEHTMTPTPSPDHQFVVGSFLYFFRLQVREGVAYAAPLDVLLSPTTIVQPDVCHVGRDKLFCVTARGLETPGARCGAYRRGGNGSGSSKEPPPSI